MKKTIIWVLGQQRSGKTRFTEFFKTNSRCVVLNIGEKIREKVDVTKAFENDSNVYSPESVETLVQKTIRLTITSFLASNKTTLIIDSAPRNSEQYEILLSVTDRVNTVIVVIRESTEIRLIRAKEKYNNLSYFNKREVVENEWLTTFIDNVKDNIHATNTKVIEI